jgi:3-oxoacyl-[acyl-carrier-protein] synthase-3
MGTVIEASATATGRPGRTAAAVLSLTTRYAGAVAPTALRLADSAARACLRRAGRRADEVDLLISAGVYRPSNLGEPALAAMIQEDIGANPTSAAAAAAHGTFSFDIYNGAAGMLTGIEVADGLLACGAIERALVVASDVGPPVTSSGFGFPPVGGALLLGSDASRPGFTAFASATFPEHEALFASYVDWTPMPRRRAPRRRGRHVLTISIDERYRSAALDCAEHTVRDLAEREALALGDVDLLIATASLPGFGAELAARLKISPGCAPAVPDRLAAAHSAAPAVALEPAAGAGAADTAVFVSVGAGITVSAALYRAAPVAAAAGEPAGMDELAPA